MSNRREDVDLRIDGGKPRGTAMAQQPAQMSFGELLGSKRRVIDAPRDHVALPTLGLACRSVIILGQFDQGFLDVRPFRFVCEFQACIKGKTAWLDFGSELLILANGVRFRRRD